MSILQLIGKDIGINSFGNQKRKIGLILIRHLLGIVNYTATFAEMRKYGIHIQFSKSIRKRLVDYNVKYVLQDLRQAAKNYVSWLTKPVVVHAFDFKFIKRLSDKELSTVKPIEYYPSEEDVFISFRPTVINKAKQITYTVKSDTSISFDDVQSELNMKLMQAYRQYILNLGCGKFNIKIFYKCLHQALATRKQDFVASTFKEKRKFNTLSFSSDLIIESVGDIFADNSSSPEDILIARETVCNNWLFTGDKRLLEQIV